MPKRDIICLGGSAGSGQVLKQVIAGLPKDFPGSLFITTHLSAQHPSYLPDLLAGVSALPVMRAVEGQRIRQGVAYMAPPDRHLLLIDSAIRLGVGPRENLARPAIDPMFRSAALSYGPRAVGVVLSGMLNDGASGLFAIKQQGGAAVVQDPPEAAADEMPRAALAAVEPDYVARADELAELLTNLARSDAGKSRPTPESLLFEVEVANGAQLGSDALRRFAEPAPLTCPDCGGVLSQVSGQQPLRFRCQVGHAFTAEQLASRNELVDEAVRIAMRVMEERVELVSRMARDARETGRKAVAELYEGRAEEYRRQAATLREAAMLSLRMSRAGNEQPA